MIRLKDQEDEVQKLTDKYVKKLMMGGAKSKEIMTV